MKFLIWIILGIVVLLLMRLLSPAGKRGAGDPARTGRPGSGAGAAGGAADRPQGTDDRGQGRELMLQCKVCGVHIPSSDAVFARGRVYCGSEHRDADAGNGRSDTGRS